MTCGAREGGNVQHRCQNWGWYNSDFWNIVANDDLNWIEFLSSLAWNYCAGVTTFNEVISNNLTVM